MFKWLSRRRFPKVCPDRVFARGQGQAASGLSGRVMQRGTRYCWVGPKPTEVCIFQADIRAKEEVCA